MKCLVLTNPNSSSQRPALLRQVIPPLSRVSHLHSVFTQYPGHAEEVVRGLTRNDFDAVIAMGGDGTVNEILQGLLGPDLANRPSPEQLPILGIIPTGSANVFARALGFPNRPKPAAEMLAELLAAQAYRRLPVGRIEGRWFCVNAGFGLDAEVIGRMEKIRQAGGLATPWRYTIVGYNVWRKLRKNKPQITYIATTSSGAKLEGKVPFVIVSNTNPWTYAGPVPLVTNPDHSIDSGFALYALNDISGTVGYVSLARAMGIPTRGILRKRADFRETRIDDITSITLTSPTSLKWQLDGELGGDATSLKLVSTPQAIDVLSPILRD